MTTWPPILPEQETARSAASVLADRLAAAIATHPPGWRLPRFSELTRRYGVGQAQIEAAIADLARRRLIRQLADGHFYRASPAEYLITFEGLPGLGAHIDPMGAFIECTERRIMRRAVPDDIRQALRLSPGTPARALQCAWAIDTGPAALSTTYMPGYLADLIDLDDDSSPGIGPVLEEAAALRPAANASTARPGAVYVEIQPPSQSIARRLHLREGQPAVTVSVMFTRPPAGDPVALTVAVLRPDLFRIAIESSPAGPHDAPAGSWPPAAQDRKLP